WAIGLEWYLLMQDPWRVAMSTDHPNGGSYLAYPEIIALLMDRSRREEVLSRLHPWVKERCTLPELEREYTLNEIAIITRAAPARMLGLKHKGHLGVGADADVTIYTPNADYQQMFELPRVVIQGGELVFEQGEIRAHREGKLLHVAPNYDEGHIPDFRAWFEKYYTVQFANYPVDDHYIHEHEVIATGG
ncbi:MAG TPA: amidohydrolase family protein, partial [Planctomycetaceae bacterium]|nr:amidohydrolase family protein [Planctomycetaceae bacterium]